MSDANKERRTCSIALAALTSVRPFAGRVLGHLGIRVGRRTDITAFVEILLETIPQGLTHSVPDGLIEVKNSKTIWRALVETKIGNAELEKQQVSDYVDIAKFHKFNAVLTISNDFVADPRHNPSKFTLRRNATVDLLQLSWTMIRTCAEISLAEDDFENQHERLILEEVGNYLADESSGVQTFKMMNKEWAEVVKDIRDSDRLSAKDNKIRETIASWRQKQRDIALLMKRKATGNAELKLPREHLKNKASRIEHDSVELVRNKMLSLTMKMPATSDLVVQANVDQRSIRCFQRFLAPTDRKRHSARVNLLRNQLKGCECKGGYVTAI